MPDRRLHRTMEFSWQSSESAQTATIDHDVGTSMSTMVLYGILATWCSSLALMAYLMRPLPHHDVDTISHAPIETRSQTQPIVVTPIAIG
jgi:hypothetical protein